MRTGKPISTISYNTTPYLKLVLDDLVEAKIISFYMFIKHKPEDDEGGKRVHHHVYLLPSKMLQTDDLKEKFIEFDPDNPDLPRKTLLFVSSKFADAYLYFLHDKRYLALKGQTRRFHYTHEELITSDPDELLCSARSIDMISLSPYADMEDAQKQGITFNEYFRRGTIPLPQLLLYQRAWDLLLQEYTYRNGKNNHEIEIDEITGEVK